ncbi:hypothetical protein DM806_20190 [Sphingobium lactosutens]|uniref:hypothetical protein n=1 Tax=Sphingobium lactosutens TaxID=522773 RepID=UPI0015BE27E1|nr:hypothetical protein [Sphingobium lactosutens]NWK97936.1 hypothetical protein [Sphingobium lactosutens]
MEYEIIRFINGKRRDGSEKLKGFPLADAQGQAKQLVETGVAERVEVRGPEDVLLFQWPRTMSVAS